MIQPSVESKMLKESIKAFGQSIGFVSSSENDSFQVAW
jgi:hypothetical protein